EVVSDKDYFQIELTAGQRYLFEMAPELLDTADLTLYGPNGDYLDDASDRELAAFSHIAERSGTYYLEARELGDDDTGGYRVQVTESLVSDDGSYASNQTVGAQYNVDIQDTGVEQHAQLIGVNQEDTVVM
uniref:hypothetical protein n=1 Tax=Halomonas sp. TaxID=1486246 RepID=UPI0026394A40